MISGEMEVEAYVIDNVPGGLAAQVSNTRFLGGVVRLGLVHYNTTDEIDCVLNALDELS